MIGKPAEVAVGPPVPVLSKAPSGRPHSRTIQRAIRVAQAIKNLETNPDPRAISKRAKLMGEYDRLVKELNDAKAAIEQINAL